MPPEDDAPSYDDGWLWAIVQDVGHLDCGGWHYGEDEDMALLACSCGVVILAAAKEKVS